MKKAKIILTTLVLAVVGIALTAGAAQKTAQSDCNLACCPDCCHCCK
jgi:hypothetical protein